MKVNLTFKNPDVLDQLDDELNEDELNRAKNALKKFIQYSEYVKIEFDIEAGTARVCGVDG